MACAECDAFRAAHNTAVMRYSDVMASLHKMATNGEFRSKNTKGLKSKRKLRETRMKWLAPRCGSIGKAIGGNDQRLNFPANK